MKLVKTKKNQIKKQKNQKIMKFISELKPDIIITTTEQTKN